MDWTLVIEINRRLLLRIVAALFEMIGTGETVRRHIHLLVLAVLRPAEAATRRLIAIAAIGLVVPARRERAAPNGKIPKSSGEHIPSFPLFDPRRYAGPPKESTVPGFGPNIRGLTNSMSCHQPNLRPRQKIWFQPNGCHNGYTRYAMRLRRSRPKRGGWRGYWRMGGQNGSGSCGLAARRGIGRGPHQNAGGIQSMKSSPTAMNLLCKPYTKRRAHRPLNRENGPHVPCLPGRGSKIMRFCNSPKIETLKPEHV